MEKVCGGRHVIISIITLSRIEMTSISIAGFTVHAATSVVTRRQCERVRPREEADTIRLVFASEIGRIDHYLDNDLQKYVHRDAQI